MVDIPEKDLALLTDISKEKFKRQLSLFRAIGSRGLALLLIISIFWFGWVNYSYANDIRQAREDYGEQWSCYLCGYENLKTCGCVYQSDLALRNPNFNITNFKEALATGNIQQCEERKSPQDYIDIDNISSINLTTK